MRTTQEIYEEMDTLIAQIDGEDAIEEVKAEYPPFEKNSKLLLESENIDSYLTEYEKICREDKAVLECFDSQSADDLKSYIADNNTNFEDLKIETLSALCEALKFIIYEAEEEEY